MKISGRYATSGLVEAQFEPGSRGRVLKNLLGIKSKREMDQIEGREQVRALEELAAVYDDDHRFTARFTPCRPAPTEDLAKAFAVVHVELVLIHPFREGNGRVARLLAVLMGLQAGLPALYFEDLSGRKRQQYLAAVRAGLEQNYEPMQKLFSGVVRRTLGIHGESVGRAR